MEEYEQKCPTCGSAVRAAIPGKKHPAFSDGPRIHWTIPNPDAMTREEFWAIQDEKRRLASLARKRRAREFFQRIFRKALFWRN